MEVILNFLVQGEISVFLRIHPKHDREDWNSGMLHLKNLKCSILNSPMANSF